MTYVVKHDGRIVFQTMQKDRAERNRHTQEDTMQTQITTTARRIARCHNQCGSELTGGVLAFDEDGTGGEWYSAGSRPNAPLVYPVGWRRVTARDVQDWLDARA